MSHCFKKTVVKRERVRKGSDVSGYSDGGEYSFHIHDDGAGRANIKVAVEEYSKLVSEEPDQNIADEVVHVYSEIVAKVSRVAMRKPEEHRSLSATPHLELLEHLKKEEQWKARDLKLKAQIRAAREERDRQRQEDKTRVNSTEYKENKKRESQRLKKTVEARYKRKEEIKTNREHRLEEFNEGQKDVRARRKTEIAKIRETSQK